MGPPTRVAVATFWESIAFALNSIIFLLMGFEVRLPDLVAYWPLILSAFLAVLLGRSIVVFGVAALVSRGASGIPAKWRAVLSWGGLRGGLSMVLALSLPPTFPNRALLIATTFGVVLLSILVQGLTMAPLLQRLGLARTSRGRAEYDHRRVELRAIQAAIAELDQMTHTGDIESLGLSRIRSDYEARRQAVEGDLGRLRTEHDELEAEDLLRARRHLLTVEKTEAIHDLQEGLANREAYEHLLNDRDNRLLPLTQKQDRPDPGSTPAAGRFPGLPPVPEPGRLTR